MIDGWVNDIVVFDMSCCSKATYLVTAKVKHSQKLSCSPLKPWVVVQKEGMVVCAHCDSVASLRESCSHVAALLFVLEGKILTSERICLAHLLVTTCFQSPLHEFMRLISLLQASRKRIC